MAKVTVYDYKHINLISLTADPSVYVQNIMQSSGSPLGNPFFRERELTRAQKIGKFKVYFEKKMVEDAHVKKLMFALTELYKQGIDIALICACSPKPCHGDVIKLWIETMAGGIL